MTEANQLLHQARQILENEIRELRRAIREKETKLAELNHLLGIERSLQPRITISQGVLQILKTSDRPLSAGEIYEKVREMGIQQKAANPHNSILALLHHLKKQPDSKIRQDERKRWYWRKGETSDRTEDTTFSGD